MTHKNHSSQSAAMQHSAALKRAQELLDTRPDGRMSVAWLQAAEHVGDLSILSLALQQ